ncbi:17096_t:CDS:2 [Funneliformis geosporum]|uniref:17096_t:CDS:1 n=1 Tax=Funneliformis geosporum TaxID=1117311 RepID=A0A9W4SC03_9GLOM|nr:17096_t:CDS:2 [Funneliformis geosporum]
MSYLKGLIARLTYPALRTFPPRDLFLMSQKRKTKIVKPTHNLFSPSAYGLIARISRPELFTSQQRTLPLTLQRRTNITIPPNYLERYNRYHSSHNNRGTQDVRDWCVQEVNEFLQIRLEEKWTPRETKIFEKNKITGSIFLDLTVEKMNLLKIPLALAFEIYKLKKGIRQKRIFIQQYDDKGYPLPNFDSFTIDCQENFEMVLRRSNAMGLELIKNHFNENINDHIPNLITSFEDLIADQEYRYDAIHRFRKKWC